MTGALLRIDITGRNGVKLRDRGSEGPKTCIGMAVSGFPNMFIITGPGSPSVFTDMVISIEQHVDWIADCIAHLKKNGFSAIGATPEAEDKWVTHVNEVASRTMMPNANSWYVGANVPGKPRIFMPYLGGRRSTKGTSTTSRARITKASGWPKPAQTRREDQSAK